MRPRLEPDETMRPNQQSELQINEQSHHTHVYRDSSSSQVHAILALYEIHWSNIHTFFHVPNCNGLFAVDFYCPSDILPIILSLLPKDDLLPYLFHLPDSWKPIALQSMPKIEFKPPDPDEPF